MNMAIFSSSLDSSPLYLKRRGEVSPCPELIHIGGAAATGAAAAGPEPDPQLTGPLLLLLPLGQVGQNLPRPATLAAQQVVGVWIRVGVHSEQIPAHRRHGGNRNPVLYLQSSQIGPTTCHIIILCYSLATEESALGPLFRIRIRIQLDAWIRIRIPNADPDPGGLKRAKMKGNKRS
jgi:hypothetical protein